MIRLFALGFIVLAISTLAPNVLQAQSLKGELVDYQNKPIPYVSIFVKELAMGTSTNEKGVFELRVPKGTYTCSFQHLSYETTIQTIEAPSDKDIIVKLIDKVYDLPVATVGTKEDPAYDMIRKAIGVAPFYMNQLSQYNAEVYIKGAVVVEKISGLVKAMAGKELNKMQFKVGDKYLQESINEIEYKQGKFKQTVKSISNTFPEQMEIGEIGMANYNIYDPANRGNMISPISPQALSYYNFKFEGFSVEGKYIVNRIKVIPKHKNAMVFEGYLYLSDGYWNVHRFELSSENMGIEATTRQTYGELEDNVWMPVSNGIDARISMLGNKASGAYVSSIRYNNYVVNPLSKDRLTTDVLPADTSRLLPANSISEKSKKITQEIEAILSKGNMSNRDAYKVSRLVQKKGKEDQKLLPDSLRIKNPLDLSDRYKVVVDSAAKKRNPDYWNNTRPVPLTVDEVKSYHIRDSIRGEIAADSLQGDSLKKKGFRPMKLLAWNSYKITPSLSIEYGGLINPEFLGFNTVDGWTYKQNLGFTKHFKDATRLSVNLEGQYAFNRKRFMFTGGANYNYWPEKQGYISVSGGVKSFDFNYENELNTFDNTLTSLFFRKNYKNYFENRYVTVSNTFEIANGLISNIGLSYHSRKQLENITDYSFFYKNSRNYRPNIPVQNPYVMADNGLVADHKAAIMAINFTYTPQMYYRKRGRTKHNAGSNYPTFNVTWRKGIKGVLDSQSDFDQLEISAHQRLNLGSMAFFRYNATAGWFPNNSNMHFRDFKDFSIKEFELLFSPFDRSYNLLKSYMPATNEWYASASAQYSSPYILLKHLPLLNRTLVQENLYFSYLSTPYLKNYTEFGYGLTNIWIIGSIGAFVGFDKFEYSNWGFKVVINLSNF